MPACFQYYMLFRLCIQLWKIILAEPQLLRLPSSHTQAGLDAQQQSLDELLEQHQQHQSYLHSGGLHGAVMPSSGSGAMLPGMFLGGVGGSGLGGGSSSSGGVGGSGSQQVDPMGSLGFLSPRGSSGGSGGGGSNAAPIYPRHGQQYATPGYSSTGRYSTPPPPSHLPHQAQFASGGGQSAGGHHSPTSHMASHMVHGSPGYQGLGARMPQYQVQNQVYDMKRCDQCGKLVVIRHVFVRKERQWPDYSMCVSFSKVHILIMKVKV